MRGCVELVARDHHVDSLSKEADAPINLATNPGPEKNENRIENLRHSVRVVFDRRRLPVDVHLLHPFAEVARITGALRSTRGGTRA